MADMSRSWETEEMTMKVRPTGAAGMVDTNGSSASPTMAPRRQTEDFELHMVDIVAARPGRRAVRATGEAADIFGRAARAAPHRPRRPDVVFHRRRSSPARPAGISTRGYAINLDGIAPSVDAIRAENSCRRTPTSRASSSPRRSPFGAPDGIHDDFPTPLTSYGTQKAIGEMLAVDYAQGFSTAIGIRLPTICVRRASLNGGLGLLLQHHPRTAGRPEGRAAVPETVRHTHATPRAAVGFLLHAATIDGEKVGPASQPHHARRLGDRWRTDRRPCARVAGDKAVALIERKPDEMIAKIVSGWPEVCRAPREGSRLRRGNLVRRHHPHAYCRTSSGGKVAGMAQRLLALGLDYDRLGVRALRPGEDLPSSSGNIWVRRCGRRRSIWQ